MKKEFLNPVLDKIKIQDLNGEIHEIERQLLTLNQIDEIVENVQGKAKSREVYSAQLSPMYGKPIDFWDQFDYRLLKDLLKETTEGLRDPN